MGDYVRFELFDNLWGPYVGHRYLREFDTDILRRYGARVGWDLHRTLFAFAPFFVAEAAELFGLEGDPVVDWHKGSAPITAYLSGLREELASREAKAEEGRARKARAYSERYEYPGEVAETLGVLETRRDDSTWYHNTLGHYSLKDYYEWLFAVGYMAKLRRILEEERDRIRDLKTEMPALTKRFDTGWTEIWLGCVAAFDRDLDSAIQHVEVGIYKGDERVASEGMNILVCLYFMRGDYRQAADLLFLDRLEKNYKSRLTDGVSAQNDYGLDMEYLKCAQLYRLAWDVKKFRELFRIALELAVERDKGTEYQYHQLSCVHRATFGDREFIDYCSKYHGGSALAASWFAEIGENTRALESLIRGGKLKEAVTRLSNHNRDLSSEQMRRFVHQAAPELLDRCRAEIGEMQFREQGEYLKTLR